MFQPDVGPERCAKMPDMPVTMDDGRKRVSHGHKTGRGHSPGEGGMRAPAVRVHGTGDGVRGESARGRLCVRAQRPVFHVHVSVDWHVRAAVRPHVPCPPQELHRFDNGNGVF